MRKQSYNYDGKFYTTAMIKMAFMFLSFLGWIIMKIGLLMIDT